METTGHAVDEYFRGIGADFPALQQSVHGKPLVYLDNAATTLKPQTVIDAMLRYYSSETSNVHRGVYYLSEKATAAYEAARSTVRSFLNAAAEQEIVFVRGTTEAINLVASSYAGHILRSGDEILISAIEHHSNIVPWQIVCESKGLNLRAIPVNDRGEILVEEYQKFLAGGRVKLVAIAHVSNAIGSIHPVAEMIRMAHENRAVVVIDGAQAVAHLPVDVRALDCDFYAFSGHKTYGPTGIGVLYGKRSLLEHMPPYQSGGEMIRTVSLARTTFNDLPHKFEAGTPAIAEAIGLGAALEYLSRIGMERIAEHEQALLVQATNEIQAIAGVRIIGNAAARSAIVSFVADGVHPHDIGTILDRDGIAIRTGHHCAMPAMERFGVPATARLSCGLYNRKEEIQYFGNCLAKALEFFR